MRIASIIENTSKKGLPVEHGLSLYIQLADGRQVLFDMGQSNLFADNAERLALSLSNVDIAVVSHGHYDHGGGLRKFLELNGKAKVYLHKDAFDPHYSLKPNGLKYIGLHVSLKENPLISLCEAYTLIDASIILFADVQGRSASKDVLPAKNCCNPTGNRLLFGPSEDKNDDFRHEQNLIVKENSNTILFTGCAHRGIVNIMQKATDIIGYPPIYVFAGMHLVKSGLNEEEEEVFIRELASHLMKYKTTNYYTMHCTGTEQYNKLKSIMGDQIHYLSCGDQVTI